MQNEDKILEMLQLMNNNISTMLTDILEIKSDVSGLKDDVFELKNDVSELKEDVAVLKEDVTELKHEVVKVQTHLENVTDKAIGLLAENYVPNVEKADEYDEKVDSLLFDVAGIKRVVISHSKEINKLLGK